MPNIKSKGPLNPRTVLIPSTLYPVGQPKRGHEGANATKKPLIEELEPASSTPSGPSKSILKKTDVKSTPKEEPSAEPEPVLDNTLETPHWTWSRQDTKLQLRVQVPKVVRISSFCKQGDWPHISYHRPTTLCQSQRWTSNLRAYGSIYQDCTPSLLICRCQMLPFNQKLRPLWPR